MLIYKALSLENIHHEHIFFNINIKNACFYLAFMYFCNSSLKQRALALKTKKIDDSYVVFKEIKINQTIKIEQSCELSKYLFHFFQTLQDEPVMSDRCVKKLWNQTKADMKRDLHLKGKSLGIQHSPVIWKIITIRSQKHTA